MRAALARTREDGFAMVDQRLRTLIEFLRDGDGRKLDHTDLEALLKDQGRQLMRKLFQAQVDSRGAGEAAGPVVGDLAPRKRIPRSG